MVSLLGLEGLGFGMNNSSITALTKVTLNPKP